MSVFKDYANYYDLFYCDKGYAAEAQYVHELLQQYLPGARSILELGCGTASHAFSLVENGYSVHGVDSSAHMLKRAQDRLQNTVHPGASSLSFTLGDIRNLRLGDRFDAAIALFHVISYLTSNQDLKETFATARLHLKDKGAFIFDCWYGPAVLSLRPEVRIKRIENDEVSVVRIAEPVMCASDNCVDVNYQVFITEKMSNKVEVLQEVHRMRYLFEPEVALLLEQAGFRVAGCFEWMTHHQARLETWNVCFVGTT